MKLSSDKRKCSIEDCSRPYLAKGMCILHYARVKNGTRLDKPIRGSITECIVDECTNKGTWIEKKKHWQLSRGMCQRHYGKWLRFGDTSFALKSYGFNQSKHPLYMTYTMMKFRCNNPNHRGYKWYGGKGIKVCDRWLGVDGFQNFISDMGERPENKTLDRIDSNGNYTPENCRWADKYVQAGNKVNSKKIPGVIKAYNRWLAHIKVDGMWHPLGSFDTYEKAVIARHQAELKYIGRKIDYGK